MAILREKREKRATRAAVRAPRLPNMDFRKFPNGGASVPNAAGRFARRGQGATATFAGAGRGVQ